MFKHLWHLALTALILLPAASMAEEMKTRVEVNTRLGTERSIGMSELWQPLSQDYDRVLYTDVRVMGDTDSNSEFNLGLGHRHITNSGTAIVGAHGWFDRRRTERGSVFHQITAGYEYFTVKNDLRINTYFPFDEEEKYTVPVASAGSVYLGGTGIFYDTNGQLVERPMHGADIEFGRQFSLPIAPETGFRASAGAFVFSADDVESVHGGRVKVSADITTDLQVGARFESDNARGSQGFLEATLRFPFGAKAANQTLAIRNRLDESPERDIDIISGSAVVNSGIGQPVISTASGEAQRIFYVDNTAAAGGDGSIENPYDTLAAASTQMTKAGDILYIFAGDGTTTNYDTHVELLHDGQGVIGQGSALVYDGGRFSAAGVDFTGTTLLAAGARPTITNTLGTFDQGWGGGVYVNADDVLLSGFTVDGALYDGIDINNSSNTTITGIETHNNDSYGMYVQASDGQTRSFALDGFTSTGNGGHGFEIDAYYAGTVWDDVTFTDITISDNIRGLFVGAFDGGIVRNISVTDSSVIDHPAEGFVFNTTGTGGIENVTLRDLYAENNFNGILLQAGNTAFVRNVSVDNIEAAFSTSNGIRIRAANSATIEDIDITNTITRNSTGAAGGISLRADATTATIQRISMTNGNSHNNVGAGLDIVGSGMMSDITINNYQSNNNQNGFSVSTAIGATRSNIDISNFTATGNTQSGVAIGANAGGSISDVSLTSITATGNATGVSIGGAGTFTDIDITDTTADTNTGTGIQFNISAGGSLSAVTVTDTTASDNNIGINMTGAGSQSNITLTDFTAISNTTSGINLNPSAGGTLSNITITNATANENQNGFNLAGSGAISNVTFDTLTANQNQNGFVFGTGNLGSRNNIDITNLTASNNTVNGIIMAAAIGNNVNDVVFSSSLIDSNATGITISNTSSGSMTNIVFSDMRVTNSTGNGLYLRTQNSSILTASLSEVSVSGNGNHGIFLDDDSTGLYNIDLGGGTLGSTGNNRIFGNTATDLRVDIDGAQLKAENNWWGNVLGLQPAETTLEVGSTVDSAPFLAADPNP